MSLSKARKAIFQAKYGEDLLGLLIEAENVIVTETGGTEVSLADKLAAMIETIGGKATPADITSAIEALNISQYATTTSLGTVDSKVDTLIGSDTGKSARVVASEVLAAAGKLERKKVASVSEIDPAAADADKYIYMVPKADEKSGDKYDEYMVIDGAVEKVGDWEVDLSDYLQKVTGATGGNLPKLKSDGTLEDSGIPASDITAAKTVTDKLATNADVLKNINAEKVSEWDGKQNALTFDASPTENSKNPVESGGVYASLQTEATARTAHINNATVHITAEERTAWNAKTKLYVGATQPAGMQSGDIWLQTFDE